MACIGRYYSGNICTKRKCKSNFEYAPYYVEAWDWLKEHPKEAITQNQLDLADYKEEDYAIQVFQVAATCANAMKQYEEANRYWNHIPWGKEGFDGTPYYAGVQETKEGLNYLRKKELLELEEVIKEATPVIRGLLLLMFLKEAGIHKILTVGNKKFQRQAIIKLGLSEESYCDSKKEDVVQWISKKTNGSGVDIFFECVGKNETVTQSIHSTMPGGKIMLVGNPYSDMVLEKSVYWKILRNQLIVIGTWNSSFTGEESDDWHYVLQRLRERSIVPEQFITHRFSLKELEKGFHIMRDKVEDYVKEMGII